MTDWSIVSDRPRQLVFAGFLGSVYRRFARGHEGRPSRIVWVKDDCEFVSECDAKRVAVVKNDRFSNRSLTIVEDPGYGIQVDVQVNVFGRCFYGCRAH